MKTLTLDELAARVQTRMRAAGLSQRALAVQSGVPQSNISAALREPSSRYVAVYERLLAAMGETWERRWVKT